MTGSRLKVFIGLPFGDPSPDHSVICQVIAFNMKRLYLSGMRKVEHVMAV